MTCRIVFDDPLHGLYGSDVEDRSLLGELFSGESPVSKLGAALVERLFRGWLRGGGGFGHAGSSLLQNGIPPPRSNGGRDLRWTWQPYVNSDS